jgi:hypothetical protein
MRSSRYDIVSPARDEQGRIIVDVGGLVDVDLPRERDRDRPAPVYTISGLLLRQRDPLYSG